jgi:tetratricopeptide (TPR) repeat protein
MCRYVLGQAVPAGFAFLLILPNTITLAGGLREEAVAYRVQGYEAQRRGDGATALSFYQKAAALDPNYPTPHNDLGILLEEGGRLEEAERAYQHALSLNPNYLEPHANLAMLYERMGQKERAIYHWMKRYQLGDPYDPWTARAEERLVGLGVLKTYPGLKGKLYSRRRIADQEFQAYDQSLEEFRTLTERHGDWP